MIRLDNITKAFDGKTVIENFSIELPHTGFCAITGRSGIGKTTLLHIIAGLTEPDSGAVRTVPHISMVFQEDRLLPWATALQNAAIASSEEKASALLTELGLEDSLHKKPRELSGGMSRRVSIARALAADADAYIMDEPLKGLDGETRSHVLNVIREHTQNALLIMVTHDQADGAGADVRIEL